MNSSASTAAETARASDLSNSVAVIAGACDDCGAGIARYLSSRGAALALCGADRDALDSLVAEIVAAGGQAIVAGSEQSAAIPDVVDRVRSKFGKIDVLVNNPGEVAGRSVELPASEFEKSLAAILTTAFGFLHAVVPAMRERRYGRIINVYGLAYLGLPAQANLAAAYAGIFGLTRSVALETAADGITVNSVVKGDIARSNLAAADADKLAGQIPVKRIGTAADVARAVGFFALPSTKYVTGQTLFVCGGRSAYFSMSV